MTRRSRTQLQKSRSPWSKDHGSVEAMNPERAQISPRSSPWSKDHGSVEARRNSLSRIKPAETLRGRKTTAPLKHGPLGEVRDGAFALRGRKTTAPLKQSDTQNEPNQRPSLSVVERP